MKEKIKLIVLIVVFIVVLILASNLLNNNTSNQEVNEIESNNTSVQENKSNVTTTVISSYNANTAAGFYTDVVKEEKTGEVFEVTEENFTQDVFMSKKKVLVEFYADWCTPCKTLSPILEEIAKENLDLKVVKIDVDANTNLVAEYGANYIPLLVVIENGKVINSAVGALPKQEILELVK